MEVNSHPQLQIKVEGTKADSGGEMMYSPSDASMAFDFSPGYSPGILTDGSMVRTGITPVGEFPAGTEGKILSPEGNWSNVFEMRPDEIEHADREGKLLESNNKKNSAGKKKAQSIFSFDGYESGGDETFSEKVKRIVTDAVAKDLDNPATFPPMSGHPGAKEGQGSGASGRKKHLDMLDVSCFESRSNSDDEGGSDRNFNEPLDVADIARMEMLSIGSSLFLCTHRLLFVCATIE
jgi:hypothetical protein